MRQQQSELDRLNVDVVVVTFEASPIALAYVEKNQIQWPVLLDTDRELYFAYGMDRGTPWQVYGPAAWWIYAKLLTRGRRIAAPTDDVHQLGGDVLIDPDGIVRLHHVGHGPADRPPVERLLEQVRSSSTDAPA